jgi:hypothetical protein
MAALTTGLAATSYTSSEAVCGPKTLSANPKLKPTNSYIKFKFNLSTLIHICIAPISLKLQIPNRQIQENQYQTHKP